MYETILIKLIFNERPVNKSNEPWRQVKIVQQEITDISVYNLHQLHRSISKAFPLLFGRIYSLHWIDMDFDEVHIENAEDLRICLLINTNMPIIIITADPVGKNGYGVRGIKTICDECNDIIVGSSFKCLTCKDYDLCDYCFGNADHSSDHRFKLSYNQFGYGHQPMTSYLKEKCKAYSITQSDVLKLKAIHINCAEASTQTDELTFNDDSRIEDNICAKSTESFENITKSHLTENQPDHQIDNEDNDSQMYQSMSVISDSDCLEISTQIACGESSNKSEDEWSIVDDELAEDAKTKA
ncbi:hypothetical protein GJ496_002357 [Pomphorhynchus laevis]|nr:hypothetical protein GJ496_002357 [Pomphorhynchus laevis]